MGGITFYCTIFTILHYFINYEENALIECKAM